MLPFPQLKPEHPCFFCVTNLDVHQESLGAPTSSSRLEPWSKQYEAALASGNDDFSQESRHGCWGNPPFFRKPPKKGTNGKNQYVYECYILSLFSLGKYKYVYIYIFMAVCINIHMWIYTISYLCLHGPLRQLAHYFPHRRPVSKAISPKWLPGKKQQHEKHNLKMKTRKTVVQNSWNIDSQTESFRCFHAFLHFFDLIIFPMRCPLTSAAKGWQAAAAAGRDFVGGHGVMILMTMAMMIEEGGDSWFLTLGSDNSQEITPKKTSKCKHTTWFMIDHVHMKHRNILNFFPTFVWGWSSTSLDQVKLVPPCFCKVTGKNSSKAFPQEIHFIADITTANDEVSRQKDLILNSNQHHQLHCQLEKKTQRNHKSQIIHIFHLNNRYDGGHSFPPRPQTQMVLVPTQPRVRKATNQKSQSSCI